MIASPYLVSVNRLSGEKCPADLTLLLTKGEDLLFDLGVEVNGEASWQPWADKGYLTENDLRNPDIAANVQAIDDVFQCIDFVARLEDELYIGYWRGPQRRSIQDSPLVSYDSEGQFALCGARFVEALVSTIFDQDLREKFCASCSEIGVALSFESLDDIVIPAVDPTPEKYHSELYSKYKQAKPSNETDSREQ